MKIYNSMSGKKEEFVPIEEGKIKMYACGITVYDLSHIGHARQAIVYAMIANYFRFKGYEVKYVRNYTDVDDKIINRAKLLGKNALEFSLEQIRETEIDMKNLHVKDADVKPKASEYINKIVEFVSKLIEKGYAYSTDYGDVYYSVRKFEEYGKLSKRNIDELINGVRKDVEEGKRDPLDFALWKSAKDGEIYWESPWGNGRPGWHIECSVMALDNLGEKIDIHGGGKDLVFPHHENEIAQSEALTGKEFAKYWSHCGLIKINGEKMSKSLGNSLTIREALKKYNYEVLKLVFLQNHYTSDIDISDEDFELAEKHLYYFYNTLNEVKVYLSNNKVNNEENTDYNNVIKKIGEDFIEAMDDDFNTTIAISKLYDIFKIINSLLVSRQKGVTNTIIKILAELNKYYSVLDLLQQNPEKFIYELRNKYLNTLDITEAEIEDMIIKRKEFKSEGDYNKADEIRNNLLDKGIILKDSKNGTKWDIKKLN